MDFSTFLNNPSCYICFNNFKISKSSGQKIDNIVHCKIIKDIVKLKNKNNDNNMEKLSIQGMEKKYLLRGMQYFCI